MSPLWFNGILHLAVVLLFVHFSSSQMRVLCYYANWSEQRNTSYRLFPRNIDTGLCSHVVYAFAMPDLSEGVVPLDFLNTLNDDQSNEFVALKRFKPELKLMLSIGGWEEGSRDFSLIAADPSAVKWITEILAQKIRAVGFDGLDLNWQWPVPGLREGSNSADKENFSKFVKVIKDYFVQEAIRTQRKELLLSIVLPQFKSYVDKGFDMETILGAADFVNIHSMDYHASTEATLNHLAPLYQPLLSRHPEPNVNSTVQLYLDLGVDPKMINMGIPFYGLSYEMDDESLSEPGHLAAEEGPPGFGMNTRGQLAYFEICKYVMDEKWTVMKLNSTAVGPYAYRGRKWVSYDDKDIIRRKVEFAFAKSLGGLTLWTVDMDDFNGICRERFPLTKAVFDAMTREQQRLETSPIQATSVKTPVTSVVAPVTTSTSAPTTTQNNRQESRVVDNISSSSSPIGFEVQPDPTLNELGPVSEPSLQVWQRPTTSAPQISKKKDEGQFLISGQINGGSIRRPMIDRNYDKNWERGKSSTLSDVVFKTPGKFTYRSTKMQYNRNNYFLKK